jgi:hypothetical protein
MGDSNSLWALGYSLAKWQFQIPSFLPLQLGEENYLCELSA